MGELSSQVAGIETIFRAIPPVLAKHLAADARGEHLSETDVDALYAQVYQAQQVIAPIVAPGRDLKIFEAGGASGGPCTVARLRSALAQRAGAG